MLVDGYVLFCPVLMAPSSPQIDDPDICVKIRAAAFCKCKNYDIWRRQMTFVETLIDFLSMQTCI